MSTTSINIQVDIPKGSQFSIEELKHRLSVYAQAILRQSKTTSAKEDNIPFLSLRGVLKTDKTDDELLDEYFKEKYKI
jgi:hypothetical protein